MTKETISKIKNYESTRDGQPLLDRNSRPYTRVTIQTDQRPGIWLSGFAYAGSPILSWRVNQQVEIDVVQKGEYWNFSIPKPPAVGTGGWSPALIEKLFTKLDTIERKVDGMEVVEEPEDEPPDATPEEDPPF